MHQELLQMLVQVLLGIQDGLQMAAAAVVQVDLTVAMEFQAAAVAPQVLLTQLDLVVADTSAAAVADVVIH
jgi:hypothetical protein